MEATHQDATLTALFKPKRLSIVKSVRFLYKIASDLIRARNLSVQMYRIETIVVAPK